jgi:hypothetical protein
MALDRAAVRRRVRTITAWSAGGAAALTAALAFGAARGNHAAARTPAPRGTRTQVPDDSGLPQAQQSPYDQQAPDQQQAPGQGFAPPSTSTAPPAGMSGGS